MGKRIEKLKPRRTFKDINENGLSPSAESRAMKCKHQLTRKIVREQKGFNCTSV